jgi:hypothetical protein
MYKTTVPAFWRSQISVIAKDKAYRYSALNAVVQAASLLLASLIIVTRLSPEVQGYYYTFLSVAALSVFIELGFSQCIIQFTSHEAAHLKVSDSGLLTGPSHHQHRLLSVGKLTIIWYIISSFLVMILVGFGGFIFFNINQLGQHQTPVAWQAAWWLLCLSIALNLIPQALLLLLDGCNKIDWSNRVRFIASTLRAIVLIAALLSGFGLYAPGLAGLCYAASALLPVLMIWRALWVQILRFRGKGMYSDIWRKELLPFQWRIAISWAAGFFSSSVFNPILFSYHGPAEAGRFGLTVALVQGIAGVSAAWGGTKTSAYGMLVSRRENAALDILWRNTTIVSVAIASALGLIFIACRIVLPLFSPVISERVLALSGCFALVVSAMLQQVISGQSFYLRAHKQEPFLVASVLSGLLCAVLALILGVLYAGKGISFGMMIVAVFSIFYCTAVFQRKRYLWSNAHH